MHTPSAALSLCEQLDNIHFCHVFKARWLVGEIYSIPSLHSHVCFPDKAKVIAMAMGKFSIEECKVMWFKNAEITPKQRQAMKAELKRMSGIIADAMKFIEEKRLADWEIYVRITFNSDNIVTSYLLEIIEEGDDWMVEIKNFDNGCAGNIVSEEWSRARSVQVTF